MATNSRVSEPRQQRSRESLERVMDAGLSVLAEDGWDGLTLQAVCDRAGVSVGMLYRRFENKDALLIALQNRFLEVVEAAQDQQVREPVAWDALSFEDALRVAVDGLIIQPRHEERLMVVLGEHGAFDEEGMRRLSKLTQSVGRWFVGGMMVHADVIAHRDPRRALEIAFRTMMATVLRRAQFGDEFDTGRGIGGWDALADELWSMGCAYLLRPEPLPSRA